ncbi:MAG: sodium:solute symporter family protein [Bacteroidetes bacterium]|nr:sodium:solute symporter family protein [Bacteroidota bacterium]
MNFGTIDWVVTAAYLLGTVAIGIWAKRYVENLAGYLVAGRKVKSSLGIATFVATELGTVTFVYYGELGYVAGFSAFIIGILSMAGYVLVGHTGFIIAALRRLRVMTIPEFYEIRFSRKVRLVGGIVLFLGGVLNMGIFLKFDGIFLSEVMGFAPEALSAIMIVMILVVIAYTILGGMFSIVVTDFMQFVVLAMGMFVATIAVLANVDLTAMSETVSSTLGDAGVDPFANPRFGWPFVVWILVSSTAAGALWQPGTSKALASESPAVAKRVFFWTGLTFAGRAMIPMFWGVAALAYFGPDLASSAAMPRLLGAIVPSGFLGLLVAGMLAASMSTYSAYLLAWSSVFARDVVACAGPNDLSERTTVAVTRIVAGTIGVFLLVFGLWYQIPDTAFQYLYVTGAMYTSGALGCVAAGIYWPRANSVGAYCALIMGAVAPAGFLMLEKWRDTLPHWLSFMTDVNIAGLLSFILAGLGMVAGSLWTQRRSPPRILVHTEEV